jgi:hypothetical protein
MSTEMPKLNQVLAVEQGLKKKTLEDVTAAYHTAQKPALFDGMLRTYQPYKDEDGANMPAERRNVQQRARDLLNDSVERLTTLFDVEATKDWANCEAKADLVVDDRKILEQVPVTFLLFLEKHLIYVQNLLEKLPTLDPAEVWTADENEGLYRSSVVEKVRTQKVAKAIVLHAPTKEHPAQTQLVNEDVNVGVWKEQKISGAFPSAERKKLLARVDKLRSAVKAAREKANLVPAPSKEVGKKVFDWLFAR